jgi:pimeloyl-ACP methyl ester carboxylesterase
MRASFLFPPVLLILFAAPVFGQADGWIDLIGDQGLEAWQARADEWLIGGDAEIDPANPKRLVAKPGKGVIVNGKKGAAKDLLSKRKFGPVEAHVEFLIPKGSNSGVKFEGQYEIQIYDSWGKDKPTASDCGGIYPRAELKPTYHHIDKGIPPRSNACKRPGEWQTLDVIFLPPRFDAAGKKTANARFVKVVLNGTPIHENVEVETPTGHAWRDKETAEGPLLLQADHGPVAFRNVRVRPYAREDKTEDSLDKASSQFVKLDDIRVHYKSLGTGETALVFIHGWTCDLTFWRAQVPAFDGKVRMVLIDLPGHGKSDKPKIDYSADLFARAVDAVLQDAGVKSAVLVGHSMGTPVARQYYRLYPKKTRALVAVDGALRRSTNKKEEIDKFIGRYKGADFKEQIGKAVDGMFPKDAPAGLRDKVKAIMQSAPQHVVVGALEWMADPAIWTDDEIKVPLQAIMAKNPPRNAMDVAYVRKLAPHVDFHVMEGVGHFLMMEKPKEFNELLTAFLEKQEILKP